MSLFKNQYRIESARLQDWDYASSGWYFVTICTKDRKCFFGNVADGMMMRNELGEIAHNYWKKNPSHFINVSLDEFKVMPNHIHGIIIINDVRKDVADPRIDTSCRDVANTHIVVSRRDVADPRIDSTRRDVACNVSTNDNFYSSISPKPGSLSTIIRSFKSAVTKWCRENDRKNFSWQSRFYDNIIRDDIALQKIREYIHYNELKWESDKNNPANLYM